MSAFDPLRTSRHRSIFAHPPARFGFERERPALGRRGIRLASPLHCILWMGGHACRMDDMLVHRHHSSEVARRRLLRLAWPPPRSLHSRADLVGERARPQHRSLTSLRRCHSGGVCRNGSGYARVSPGCCIRCLAATPHATSQRAVEGPLTTHSRLSERPLSARAEPPPQPPPDRSAGPKKKKTPDRSGAFVV